jgi:hypothetical protein
VTIHCVKSTQIPRHPETAAAIDMSYYAAAYVREYSIEPAASDVTRARGLFITIYLHYFFTNYFHMDMI